MKPERRPERARDSGRCRGERSDDRHQAGEEHGRRASPLQHGHGAVPVIRSYAGDQAGVSEPGAESLPSRYPT